MVVTVRLQGGLGNQLFQYAAARQLAQIHGTDLALDIAPLVGPVGSAQSGRSRRFELHPLRTKGAICCLWTEPLATRLRIRVAAQLPTGMARWFGVFREPYVHCARALFKLPSQIYLIGFFQSERYFSGVTEEIRRELRPRDGRLLEEARAEIAQMRRPGRLLVSVHVRRTDYLKLAATGHVYSLGSDYYGPAMARFGPSADYLLFSDDPAWCRDHMRGNNIFYCGTGRALDDLLRMSLCDHHIIANSTFSWWGAWLNGKADKIVVAPRRWLGPSSRYYNYGNRLPTGWIVL